MKITPEAVKERISALESAGELSLKEQFYLEALRLLVAGMDSEPVAWTWQYREQWHVTSDPRRAEFVAKDGDVAVLPLYRHAQPVPASEPVADDGIFRPGDAVGVFNVGCETCPDHLVAWTVKGQNLPSGNYWLYISQLTAPVVPDERAAFNAWNNDIDCPLTGRDAKSAAWMAWQARAELAGNSPVIGIDMASGQDHSVEVRYVADRWIPVSERMPEDEEQYYLTYSEGYGAYLSYFFDGYFANQHITHWMPLPAAPQESKP